MSSPVNSKSPNFNQFEIAIDKKTSEICKVEKGFWTFIGKHIYSRTYDYDLVKIKNVLVMSLEELEHNFEQEKADDLIIPLTIYERNVIEYNDSLWLLLFDRNENICSIATETNLIAQRILKTRTTASTGIQSSLLFQLFDPPKNGSQIGLPNIGLDGKFGNTCWLNSILKLMSSGKDFDEMLTRDTPGQHADVTLARQLFCDVLATIRTGKEPQGKKRILTPVKQVSNELYIRFLESLVKLKRKGGDEPLIPTVNGIGHQQDAPEFFISLTQIFDWDKPVDNEKVRILKEKGHKSTGSGVSQSPDTVPQLVTVYTLDRNTKGSFNKSPKRDSSSTILTITVPPSYLADKEKPIDLSKAAKDRDTVEARPDGATGQNISNYKWESQKKFTKLPDTLFLSLKRAVIEESIQQSHRESSSLQGRGEFMEQLKLYCKHRFMHEDTAAILSQDIRPIADYQRKLDNPVLVDREGLISFIEYTEQVSSVDDTVTLVPHRKRYYQIAFSIVHEGDHQRGHYVGEERLSTQLDQSQPKPLGLRHSDTSVTEVHDINKLGTKGSILKLTFVKNEPIPGPDASPDPIVRPPADGGEDAL